MNTKKCTNIIRRTLKVLNVEKIKSVQAKGK